MLPKNNTGAGIGAALTVVLVFVLQQFSIELGAGHVPIPDAYRWLVPILGAAIAGTLTVLTPYWSQRETRTGRRRIVTPPDAPVDTLKGPD